MFTTEDTRDELREKLVDRAARLYSFLHDLVQLRTNIVRNVSQYEKVLWVADLPREKGCRSVFTDFTENTGSEKWLEVRKPGLSPPPPPPPALAPWIDPAHLLDPTRDAPALLEEIIHPDYRSTNGRTPPPRLKFKEVRQEIFPQWEAYVESLWWPWREQERHKAALHKVFGELYAIYQRQQKLGEAYEVVLGLGCLHWKTADGTVIRRHLLTAQTHLMFDPDRQIITIGPAGEGANVTIEQEMLDARWQLSAEQRRQVSQLLQEMGDDISDHRTLGKILRQWQTTLPGECEYDPDIYPGSDISPTPRIVLAPAFILRKRTDQILLRLYSEIIDQIKTQGDVPEGVRSLIAVNPPAAATPSPEESGEVFFPLPANEEQREIVTRFQRQQGVVVQGPPGTGKSHTIANLVCHLLASGKRVLVTSHTARALKVLRKMIPEELAALCVVALGDDEIAINTLEKSVAGILEKHRFWNPAQSADLIRRLEEKRTEVQRLQRQIVNDMVRLRENAVQQFSREVGNYDGTLQHISARIGREQTLFGWFCDALPPGEAPLLTDTQAVEYLNLLRKITPQQETVLQLNLVNPADLLTPEEFETAREQEAAARKRFEGQHIDLHRLRQDAEKHTLLDLPPERRKEILALLNQILDTYDLLDYHAYPWVRKAAQEALDGRYTVWEILVEKTREHLDLIKKQGQEIFELQVSGLKGRDYRAVREDALSLLAHMKNEGAMGFGPFRPRVVRDTQYLTRDILLNGHPCDGPERLEQLIEYIEVWDRFESLASMWSPYTETPKKAPFNLQLAEYENFLGPLRYVLALNKHMTELKTVIALIPELPAPQGYKIDKLRELRTIFQSIDIEDNLQSASRPFQEMERLLQTKLRENHIHPILKELLAHIIERDLEGYVTTRQTLKVVWDLRSKIEWRTDVSRRLQERLPKLHQALTQNPHDPQWDSRMAHFTDAWNWKQAGQWLQQQHDSGEFARLKDLLRKQEKQMRQILTRLAAEKAWQHCFERMSDTERQNLEAWNAAIKRLGKGTGKYARQDRRNARQHLEGCRNAIPAWVMPIYRVAETVRPGREMFDVVIIDEASQSGPEALFLSYLAKKIVVVGDDKQISPEFIGTNRQDVEELRQKYLFDIPHSDVIGLDNSFFDQAQIRFGNPVRLREHFRCMPEIIAFSNQLCYHNEPLVPLRQYGSSRLTPVIIRRYIQHGKAENAGGVINRAEAEALVLQVQKCGKDPAYEGKSMGVISLQGNAQARLIEKLLIRKIGVEEMEKRNLVCGDPYAFQGDERDVIFLSMVAAPNRRIGVLSSEKDMRRFNVGFSRARDQVWLFHSVLPEDLSKQCLRWQLLNYCQGPGRITAQGEPIQQDELWEEARSGVRDRIAPPLPFDSWFEVDLYLRLTEKGLKVIPQYEIDRYRIDLLVEDKYGSVAIECLGDRWEGADAFARDIMRQIRLEECGWRFMQVYASDFYLAPEAVLERILTAIAELQPGSPPHTNGLVKDWETLEKSYRSL